MGHFGHAYDYFTRSGELAPGRAGVVFSRAQALRHMGGRRLEAIALYEQYLSMGGGGRKEEAKQHLAELKVAPTGDKDTDEAAARKIFDKGGAYFEAGDYGHAFDEFQKAGELTSRPGIIFSEAQSLRKLGGRRAEAIALYEQYLAMPGGSRKEDAQKALDELRASPTGDADADTKTAHAVFDKGGADFEAGRYGQAADKFAKAHDLSPDRAGIVFSEAQALRKQGGHREEAIALYKEYLEMGGGTRTKDAKFYLDALSTQGAAYY
jgi:tetratricopeptide (TPR) repeat protein